MKKAEVGKRLMQQKQKAMKSRITAPNDSNSKFSLDESFWNDRYRSNQTGWDINLVSPPIKSYIDSINDKKLRILIPGCGNAYEATYLLDQGFDRVNLVDLSSVLIDRLKEKFKGKSIRIIHSDFFEHEKKYDLIIEQTFFCALDLTLRQRYVEKCLDLLGEHGKLAGLLFNVDFGFDHPPFGGKKEDYQKVFEPFFDFIHFEACKNSIPQRMGNELFFEFVKKKNL